MNECDPSKLREETIEIAQKIFCMAEAALEEHSEVKKVIVVRNTPRFDPNKTDSAQLKPKLALLADSVLFGLWCESKYKDSIVLGCHDINEWSRYPITKAYGFPHIDGYDGVHLYGSSGRAILTRSLINMLKHSFNTNDVPDKLPVYDPMLVLRERIQSDRSKLPALSSSDSQQCRSRTAPPRPETTNRASVIKPTPAVSQEDYNIPISNYFDSLGNF